MCRIKYFINRREPDAMALAQRMRESGIEFSSMPTSGPLMLWVDGRTSYGPTAVKYAIHQLVEPGETYQQQVAL